MLLEGPHLVGEALEAGLELEAVLATPAFGGTPAGQALIERLPRPPLEVDASLLDAIADSDSPRGLVAIGVKAPASLDELSAEDSDSFVFADGLQDPGNVGALARVAEAAGARALLLSAGTVSAAHPRALRASAGSLLRLPVIEGTEPQAVSARLGGAWFRLQTRGGSSLYGAEDAALLSASGPRILAVGAEGAGLSREVEAAAGFDLTVPLAGQVESLNAAVAAAVVLFEWRRRALAG
ncbi:MAG: RNA methyltransferase [Acidobacteriota bacterium]